MGISNECPDKLGDGLDQVLHIPGMESGREIIKAAKGSPLLPFPLAGEARVRIRTGMEGGVLSLTF